jgi:S-adenosylmethionine hydrolase
MRKLILLLVFLLFGQTVFAGTVVFMSDFGNMDDSVAICKGVILGIAPGANIIDLTHQVTPYSVQEGARFLAGTTPYFPEGTVFLVVVDPGVGSKRKPMIVKSKKGHYFVLPDNGLISLVSQQDGIEDAREISNPEWMIGKALSSTFHGRDIFSPAAAHLITGKDWRSVGPVITDLVDLPANGSQIKNGAITGEVIGLDGPYGNLITNIRSETLEKLNLVQGDFVDAMIGGQKFILPFVKTFSDVPAAKPLLYIDSRGRAGVAINQGNFAQQFRITPPVPIVLQKKK